MLLELYPESFYLGCHFEQIVNSAGVLYLRWCHGGCQSEGEPGNGGGYPGTNVSVDVRQLAMLLDKAKALVEDGKAQ